MRVARCFIVIILLVVGCAEIDNYSIKNSPVEINKLNNSIDRIRSKVSTMSTVLNDPVKVAGSKHEVNLVGVSLGDAIKVVYGEALGVPFVVSKDVCDLPNRIDISIKRHITANELKEIMKQALNMVGVQVIEKEKTIFISMPISGPTGKPIELDKDIHKTVCCIYLKNISPDVLMKRLSTVILSAFPDFIFTADLSADVIFFVAQDKEIEKIKKLITDSDVEEKQIYCEVMLIQAVHEGVLNNGLLAYLSASLQGITSAFSFGAVSDLSGMAQLSLVTNPQIFNVVLSELQSDSIINTLANPYLLVRSGHVANLSIGDQIPILSNSTMSTSGSVDTSIVYKSTGITLDLNPIVINDIIYMDVKVTLSNGSINQLSTINSPSISSRSVSSSLKIINGQAVLLGGIYQTNDNYSRSGLPIQNDIVQNYVNKNRRDKITTELLIYLRPLILDIAKSDQYLSEKQIHKLEIIK